MPATRRVSLPVHAWPETALGAAALLCPDVTMLGWAYALSILHVSQRVLNGNACWCVSFTHNFVVVQDVKSVVLSHNIYLIAKNGWLLQAQILGSLLPWLTGTQMCEQLARPEVKDGRDAGILKGQCGTCQADQPGSSLSVPSRGLVAGQEQGRITRAVLWQQDCCHSAHLDRVAQWRSSPVHVQAMYL